MHISTRLRAALAASLMVSVGAVWPQPSPRTPAASASPALLPADEGAEAAAEAAPPSLPGVSQQVYRSRQKALVQIRTLLQTQDSQSSVGSGFVVSDEGHLITNFHVVSDYALAPQRQRLVYVTDNGQQGALALLAFDVVHDLALLKPVQAGALQGREAMPFRPTGEPMERGARIFSLGNPLDVGFTVNEGAYNGFVERSYVPQLFFGGSLSPGMSGGPALDERGRVIGVNVATRVGGEQVSFLVPGSFAQALFERGRRAAPITTGVQAALTAQLLAHQEALVRRFIALPWRMAGDAHYRIPVPQETFMRCWGSGSDADDAKEHTLLFERSDCAMDSRVYVSERVQTGYIDLRHETYDGRAIGPLRFAKRHADSFANEPMGRRTREMTAPQCAERTVAAGGGLPLRAVVCQSAYRKLPGLYDVSVVVASLDGSTRGVQGRLNAYGVSEQSVLKLTEHYLNGFGWMRASP